MPAEGRGRAAEAVEGLILLLPYSLCMDGSALTETDEAMYAAMARGMVQSGDWLVPRLGGEPFGEQPPGVLWLIGLSLQLLGETERAVRLPSLLCLLGAALLLHRVADRRALPWLLSMPAWVLMARDARLDAVLCLGLTAVFVGLSRGRLGLVAMGAAVGCLAKGLVAVAIPALALVIAGAWERDRRRLWPALGLLAGPLCWGAWALAAPELAQEQLWASTLGRFWAARTGETTPLYYLHTLAWAGAPAAAVVAVALWRGRSRWKQAFDLPIWPLSWTLAVLIPFSLSASKLPQYVFPALPALALLAAAAQVPRWLPALMAAVSLGFLGLEFGIFFPAPAPIWALAALAAAALAWARARAPAWTALGLCALSGWHYPAFDQWKPYRALAAELPAEPLSVAGLPLGSMAFYFDAPLRRSEDPAADLAAGRLLLTTAGRARRLCPSGCEELASGAQAHVSRATLRFMWPPTREAERVVVLRLRGGGAK